MNLPQLPQEGKSVAGVIRSIIGCLRAWRVVGVTGGKVIETPNGTRIIIDPPASSGKGSSATFPFSVTLKAAGTTEAPTYSVQVADGWVNERIPGVFDPVANATAVHKPHNILWGADGASQDPVKAATDRRDFPITIGQQVSVVVFVNAEGNVALPDGSTEDGPTKIGVEEEDYKSIHYVPPRPQDEDEGSAGEYHYKLAVLRDADGTHSGPWLEMFLAGSHMDHFAELPILDNMAAAGENKGRVFEKYDPDTNTYQFRVIDTSEGELEITETEGGLGMRGNSKNGSITVTEDGGSPTTVAEWVDGLMTTEGTQNIDIPASDFPGGGNLNHEIYQLSYDNDGHIYGSESLVQTLYWRNGLYIGTTDPMDSETVTPDEAVSHKLVNQA